VTGNVEKKGASESTS